MGVSTGLDPVILLPFRLIVGEDDELHNILAVYPCCQSVYVVESPLGISGGGRLRS